MISVPIIAVLAMVIGSSVLLFARLGRYSLWTDEAITAITTAGVWRTGDTSAWLDDHNLLTYRNGLLLRDQKDRYTSPLQFYFAAPFIGLLGHTSFAARLPFSLCGLGTVFAIVLWLRRVNASNTMWIASAVALLTNSSFFLFQRQCRYFALATVLGTAIAHLYCRWDGTRRRLVWIGILMSLLLATQYLDYAAAVGCLLVDYGIWGRRRRAIRGINWLILIVPQLIVAMIVVPIWNPIERATQVVQAGNAVTAHAVAATTGHAWLHGFLTLIWWNWRDLVACDFVILPLLILCPLLYFKSKDAWLLRAPIAMGVFICGIALFTAHPLPAVGNAEVRYLAPLLPLCIGIAILAIRAVESLPGWARAFIFGLSILWIGQSSTLAFYRELINPVTEPYTPVASWVNHNVTAGSTVYICPDWCVSSVMWNASKPTYVWQLSDPPAADYTSLPGIYFKGRIAPDYLIAFGPFLDEIKGWQSHFADMGIHYEPVATLPVYYNEMYRPELIWRSFKSIAPAADQQIYIFRKK